MAQRNQDFWNEDFRRGQDSREWGEGRQERAEWRAARGGYEGRGYEGRDFGRFGREDLGRGGFGHGEGRHDEGRMGRGLGRYDEGRGSGDEFVRGYQGSEGRFEERGERSRYGMGGHRDGEYGPGRMSGGGYSERDIGPYGREDSERYGGVGRERGFGRYGRGGESLRSIGYGMARMDVGERRMGRGPRSYVRSDERIREDLCERLMQGWMNAENVDVQVKGGEVTLLGTVDRREEKRAIEDLAESVLGVKEVHNQLRVSRPGERVGAQGQTTRGLTDAGGKETGMQSEPSSGTSMHS